MLWGRKRRERTSSPLGRGRDMVFVNDIEKSFKSKGKWGKKKLLAKLKKTRRAQDVQTNLPLVHIVITKRGKTCRKRPKCSEYKAVSGKKAKEKRLIGNKGGQEEGAQPGFPANVEAWYRSMYQVNEE